MLFWMRRDTIFLLEDGLAFPHLRPAGGAAPSVVLHTVSSARGSQSLANRKDYK
jgi:hypothetical protein